MKPKTYKEQRKELEAEQSAMTPEQIRELMKKQSEWSMELDNLPPTNHVWTDRGAKLTCEGAGHPYHEFWKPR